jgi:hypothetical protein
MDAATSKHSGIKAGESENLNFSPDEIGVGWDEPPPYELHSSGALLASSCTLQGIGLYLPWKHNTNFVI